jgi:mono/diheme cytochrome c family protein
VIFQSCEKEKEKEGKNETNISSKGEFESHNMGQNCMNCHKAGGEGEGWFNAAGTVYTKDGSRTNPNGTISLYTGPNATGDLKATIEVDGLGNFYTTESIDFNGGVYPSLQGSSSTMHMSTSITSGQCNSCHGVSTDKLWTE